MKRSANGGNHFFLNCKSRNINIKKNRDSHRVVVQLKAVLIPKNKLPRFETSRYISVTPIDVSTRFNIESLL